MKIQGERERAAWDHPESQGRAQAARVDVLPGAAQTLSLISALAQPQFQAYSFILSQALSLAHLEPLLQPSCLSLSPLPYRLP